MTFRVQESGAKVGQAKVGRKMDRMMMGQAKVGPVKGLKMGQAKVGRVKGVKMSQRNVGRVKSVIT